MTKKISCVVTVCALLLTLPGCCRWIDWGRRTFYQGRSLKDQASIVRSYIRSVAVYDQFSTRAIFDALWLSNEVRTAYVQVRSCRLALDNKHYDDLLEKQRAENKHTISFYVLTLYDVTIGGVHNTWSTNLLIRNYNPKTKRIDTIELSPLEIRLVELSPEYRAFMECQLTRFKVCYQVSFDIYTTQGKPYLNKDTRELVLDFRSPNRAASLSWTLDAHAMVIKPACIPPDEPYSIRVQEPCDQLLP